MRFGIDTLLPNGSAVAARMVTIATGVFSLFDVADGVIRALVGGKSKIGALAVKDFFLHVNFVGIARFAFAVRTDYQVSSNARKKAQSIPYSGFENRGNGYGDDSWLCDSSKWIWRRRTCWSPSSIRRFLPI